MSTDTIGGGAVDPPPAIEVLYTTKTAVKGSKEARSRSRFLLGILMILALVTSACSQSASTSERPTGSGVGAARVQEPLPSGNPIGKIQAVSGEETCVVSAEGRVRCWGKSDPVPRDGQVDGVSGQIADLHANCALTTDGTVWCRKDATFLDDSAMVRVQGLDPGVTQLAGNEEHMCALTRAGGVKCWGSNDRGQLGVAAPGRSDGLERSDEPVAVPGLEAGTTVIDSSAWHTCAIQADVLKCWGFPYHPKDGRFGVPIQISGLDGAVKGIALGAQHDCVLLKRGGVECWGDNGLGQLGPKASGNGFPLGAGSAEAGKVDVEGLPGVVRSIASGGLYTCALLETREVACWGAGSTGTLGGGELTDSATPRKVVGLTEVHSLSLGHLHACALMLDQSVKCWGRNMEGQVGGTGGSLVSTPVEVPNVLADAPIPTAGSADACSMSSLQVPLIQKQIALADPTVAFCNGKWALVNLGGEGDSSVILQNEAAGWAFVTGLPSAFCVDQLAAKGAPAEITGALPPCA